MQGNKLSTFIVEYIKDRAKQKDITISHSELVKNWLDDAARRAKQISMITHALKYSNSQAKGSSIYAGSLDDNKKNQYLSTSTLHNPVMDFAGNSAAFDIAKLLTTEIKGDSLAASLKRGDYSAFSELVENEQQLELWVDGFKQALSDDSLSSHKYAKQLYFPINENHDEYHLLSPLFASSLYHVIDRRIQESRFSESAKEIREAIKDKCWHPRIREIYKNTAIQHFGGTKPQNTSYLNTMRGGKAWLLPCTPPLIPTKPPIEIESIFSLGVEFDLLARDAVLMMQQYLIKARDSKITEEIFEYFREFIVDISREYLSEIIDTLFDYVGSVQNLIEYKGWSASKDCALKYSQQLWLDPYRCEIDEKFKHDRESGAWKNEVAKDFGRWLSRCLRHEKLDGEALDRRNWKGLFIKQLDEFEDYLPKYDDL
ncbi:type I-F CRISPR-associated protein Csy1 [Photorhabdus sp. APURE]|uniref:type I-F CRISPR-associated protein Csy1 n=1 Tax=Photorhabdus aballayi TaxID=2991723 RepID=UPI00223D05E2|nr:type I-F CRISPR-associated protein Csy1 [Photorhabdus aballayi]MCW7549874.1 type I-F CRISPR-associated protein Csy1 [Photorhabdus aballayi]